MKGRWREKGDSKQEKGEADWRRREKGAEDKRDRRCEAEDRRRKTEDGRW